MKTKKKAPLGTKAVKKQSVSAKEASPKPKAKVSTGTQAHFSRPNRGRKGGSGGREDAIAKHPAFLEHLANSDNVRAACRASGLAWRTAFRHRREIPDFAAAWEDARQQAKEEAHGELYQRGVIGWDEPVYQGGDKVGTIRVKSDRCLTYYLEHNFPEVYGNKSKVDVTVKDELPIEEKARRLERMKTALTETIRASLKSGQT